MKTHVVKILFSKNKFHLHFSIHLAVVFAKILMFHFHIHTQKNETSFCKPVNAFIFPKNYFSDSHKFQRLFFYRYSIRCVIFVGKV